MPRQNLWRWCNKCQGLFYSGGQGACPAGGYHDGNTSGHYDVILGDHIPGAQNFWRWCKKCQGLFYTGNPDQGKCPKGGSHDGSGSAHYSMMSGDNVARTQGGWRWCYKCEGLFYSGSPDQGKCPAGGNHNSSQSAQYGASWERSALNQISLSTGSIGFPSGVAVGGAAYLNLYPDGSYQLSGYFHDSGAPDYTANFLWIVQDSVGNVLTFAVSGEMYGTFTPGSRDWNFNQQSTNSAIAGAWDDLSVSYNAPWQASTSVDVGTLWNNLKSAVGTAEQVIGTVGQVVAVVGPLLA